MRCIRKESSAFTFVEMVIVSAMVAVVALAIYATLSNGVKVYKRVSAPLSDEDVLIFLDKFSKDVKNSLTYSGISASGAPEKLEIVTLVNSPRFPGKTIGKVAYFFSRSGKMLQREQYDFSQVYKGEGILTETIKNVESCGFKYYFYDKEKKEYLWKDEWGPGDAPLAVRTEFGVKGQDGTNTYRKTVSIPVNG